MYAESQQPLSGIADDSCAQGYPVQSSDTVQFAVTDQWGNAVSSITLSEVDCS